MQVLVPNTKVTGRIFFKVVGGVVWITITTTAILVIAFSAYIFLQSRLNTSAFAEIPNFVRGIPPSLPQPVEFFYLRRSPARKPSGGTLPELAGV